MRVPSTSDQRQKVVAYLHLFPYERLWDSCNDPKYTFCSLQATFCIFPRKAGGQIEERLRTRINKPGCGSSLEHSLVCLNASVVERSNINCCESFQDLQFNVTLSFSRNSVHQFECAREQCDGFTMSVAALRVLRSKSQISDRTFP